MRAPVNSADAAMIDGHECVLLAAEMNGHADLPTKEQDFASPPNRTIFQSIRRLKVQDQEHGLLAVQDHLQSRRKLAEVGGPARLTEIFCLPTDEANVRYALGEVLEASRKRQAIEIGARLRQGVIGPDEAVTSLNSLRSLDHSDKAETLDDFPEPLSEVAFYGLAGDIVRRIDPHTEADPAALLIQVLIAFGNVIGREAFAMADGSRHATNLFCVLVGESSKSRKGTSWQHVLRVFECAADDWTNNCIANGLSSGEGLIWAVRNAITKTFEDNKTGQPKTQIVDVGISDKRLCVTEGEFANVLKVMTREGNTLSPVIRASWDSGNLRTLTKNSPARASDAHISIIGHITNCELRRLLTETESANGFGNRFLWVAVRRSKCLPEGGNIGTENLADLVLRLHDAIQFGRSAGVVIRGEGARELWRIVYPQLSEGKAGLLGAITARAEAQVLRLSAIYALLDCSTTIEIEHHRAALALWNYCERSARWIFGAGTGDVNADRIMLALRIAGRSGLTRKQILDDVFRRNVSGNVLTAALQSLRRFKLAYCRTEPTGGKPRERWFASKSDTP